MTKHVYLLSAARTPVGSFQGQLASLSAPELGAHAARAALQFGAVDPTSVDEVILGNVVSAGLKQAPGSASHAPSRAARLNRRNHYK